MKSNRFPARSKRGRSQRTANTDVLALHLEQQRFYYPLGGALPGTETWILIIKCTVVVLSPSYFTTTNHSDEDIKESDSDVFVLMFAPSCFLFLK